MSTSLTGPQGDKRFVGKIDLGAVVQALTVIGSTIAGLITAGGYVQSIAHDVHAVAATQTAMLAAQEESMLALRQLLQDRPQRALPVAHGDR